MRKFDHIDFFPLPGMLDFGHLPWNISVDHWNKYCPHVEQVEHGLSRHPVVFINNANILYAIKELPLHQASNEYHQLSFMASMHIPTVKPIGYVERQGDNPSSLLVTQYLESSIPFRTLFIRSNLNRYRAHLLDAMAGLLVQLHLVGIFWGDCSLSNTLFRRSAGELQAYLVDAETAESHKPPPLPPTLRHHDMEIMQANILTDLDTLESIEDTQDNLSTPIIGEYIRQCYRALWEEVTKEVYITPDEGYRIQERIRALNSIGFSVKDIEKEPEQLGGKLRLRFIVTDRNFHRDLLLQLTGIEAQENQARHLLNEIRELKIYQSNQLNYDVSLEGTAHHWFENYYTPVINHLKFWIKGHPESKLNDILPELYCQILEHKWYLSEQSGRDVGHLYAVDDYLHNIGSLI